MNLRSIKNEKTNSHKGAAFAAPQKKEKK